MLTIFVKLVYLFSTPIFSNKTVAGKRGKSNSKFKINSMLFWERFKKRPPQELPLNSIESSCGGTM
jgi:hypothetical protein